MQPIIQLLFEILLMQPQLLPLLLDVPLFLKEYIKIIDITFQPLLKVVFLCFYYLAWIVKELIYFFVRDCFTTAWSVNVERTLLDVSV